MAKTGSPYRFDGEVPTAEQLQSAAESLGGLRLKRERIYGGGADLEFECYPGKVRWSKSSDGIFLMSDTGEAPVLHDLLDNAAYELGGRSPSRTKPRELQLPLTKEIVESSTLAFRREIADLARRAWLLILGIVVAGLGALAGLIWLVWKFLA